jgi:hypothetical protein
MLLKNKHKINHIKIIINICIIVIYSIIFINKVVLANEGVCTDNGCYETRVIKVLVLYDDELFFERGWENNLNNRLAEINDFYYSNFKIKWKVIAIKQYAFNKNVEKLSTLFSLHKETLLKLETDAEVILSIIGRDIKGSGIAATFSNIIMVSNYDKLLSYRSSVIIAHEFGHLFGAWHTQRREDFMLVSGASNLHAGKESSSILKLMRNYSFVPETIINNTKTLNRISRLYDRHHARGEINPVARLLTDYGNKYYLSKKYNKALDTLKNSIKYYARWGKTRMLLSKTYYELGMYSNAFTELTRAMFFGSQPDLDYEDKLKNKFIELNKLDPSINNPFIPS